MIAGAHDFEAFPLLLGKGGQQCLTEQASWQRASKLEAKIPLQLTVVSRLSRHGPLKRFILSSMLPVFLSSRALGSGLVCRSLIAESCKSPLDWSSLLSSPLGCSYRS